MPWWRKAWVWWSAPALAAAAVLVVVITRPSDEDTTVARQDQAANEDKQQSAAPAPAPATIDASREGGTQMAAEAELAEAPKAEAEESLKATAADEDNGYASGGTVGKGGSGKSAFEINFAKLAPHGRLAIRVGVDQSRDELRSQLLATARGGAR